MTTKTKKVRRGRQYVVTTPNPNYVGKVAGVQFFGGKALVTEETLDKFLGFPLERVIKKFRDDFGYDVVELVEE